MDAFIRFARDSGKDYKGRENCFKSLKKVQKYFCTLNDEEENNNFFFHPRNIQDIKNGSKLYFMFDGKVVARAIYTGSMTDEEREEKFRYGYEIKNVMLFCPPIELKENPCQGRVNIRYIGNNKYQIDEEDKKNLNLF